MNDGRDVLFSRGVPDAKASANNNPQNSIPSAEHRITQSTESLSLQNDSLNGATVTHGNSDRKPAYIESSEHGRQPDIPTTVLTDSLSGLPSFANNGVDHAAELDNSHTSNGHTTTPQMDQKLLDSRLASQIQSTKEDNSIDRWHPSLSPIKAGNSSISALPSPKHSRTRSNLDARFTSGQKRKAGGNFKSILHSPAINSVDESGPARRRSKSTGSSAYGSRIAQLSVHIRTRLSYAAAKVEEQARQSHTATAQPAHRALNSGSPSSPSAPSDIASLPARNSTPFSQDSQTSANGNPYHLLSHSRSRSAFSSNQFLPIPKLAPPVDIISSNNHHQRRRPNPNAISKPSHNSTISHHRHHYSNQDNGPSRSPNGSVVLGPGTPSLSSSHTHAPKSTPNGFDIPRSHIQNTLMEQDAIETLMFMSSPENSGYHFSTRPLQPASAQGSLNESLNSSSNGPNHNGSQSSQTSESHNGQVFETKPWLEAHAGDDIDRLLDQMDSDSEDEGRYASYRHRINGAHPFRGHQTPR